MYSVYANKQRVNGVVFNGIEDVNGWIEKDLQLRETQGLFIPKYERFYAGRPIDKDGSFIPNVVKQ